MPMRGIRTSKRPLDEVLAPISYYTDECWWYFGGQGISLAGKRWPRVATDKVGHRHAMEEWTAESKHRAEELYRYVVNSPVGWIGKHGFFSRFARGLSSDWCFYFASDAVDEPFDSFAKAEGEGRKWFAPPAALPGDICIFVRGIDGAYWDIFFRDEWMYETVWRIVRRRNGVEEIGPGSYPKFPQSRSR